MLSFLVRLWWHFVFLFFYLFFFLICSEFCHTLEWNSHGFTCVPHPDPRSHLPLHPLPLGFPSAPGSSACLMHMMTFWMKTICHIVQLRGSLHCKCLCNQERSEMWNMTFYIWGELLFKCSRKTAFCQYYLWEDIEEELALSVMMNILSNEKCLKTFLKTSMIP